MDGGLNGNREDRREERLDVSLLRAAPTLMRLAAGAYVRTAQWGLATSARVGSRLVRAAAAGESPAELAKEAGEDVRDYARHFLGLRNGSDPLETEPAPESPEHVNLRERGAELLAPSADVEYDEPVHPAFDTVLEQVADGLEGPVDRLVLLHLGRLRSE